MPGMLTVAQSELMTSVRIAIPDFIGVRDPSFTSGVGIIQFVAKYMRSRQPGSSFTKKVTAKSSGKKSSNENKTGSLDKVKNFFSDFI
jgi:cell division protein FtsA